MSRPAGSRRRGAAERTYGLSGAVSENGGYGSLTHKHT
jgi:hypothetical protein